jgi:diadenosine tetraphosphate (Ap4A) HIT family hydrolase
LAGLVGSVAINSAPLLIQPVAIMETDKTVAIKNPVPEAAVDYVIIPKKDIKDVGELSNADKIYLDDVYAVIERLIEKYKLRKYQVVTYGPDRQQVRYLHFHLKSVE